MKALAVIALIHAGRIEGPVFLEVDGEPTLAVICALYHNPRKQLLGGSEIIKKYHLKPSDEDRPLLSAQINRQELDLLADALKVPVLAFERYLSSHEPLQFLLQATPKDVSLRP